MTYILLLILIGLFALILSITQATAINSTTVTTVTNGTPTTQAVPAVAANVQFLQGAITSTIAMLGGLIGVVLAVVLIANGLGSEYGWNTLTSARFLFLRTDVESFKEALIRYIDTFRLGNGATSQLSQSSWESFDKQFWPQKNTIKQLETAIDQHNLSGMYRIGSAKSSVDNLWNSLQKIVTASGSNIFEGREHLVKRAVFTALYEVGLLRADILHLIQSNNEDDEIDLTSVNQRIRLCAITCTKVLEDMADLASSVKTK